MKCFGLAWLDSAYVFRIREAYPTNSKEHETSLEDDSRLAKQQTSCLLWNPRVHHRLHKSHPYGPVLSRIQSTNSHFTSLRSILISFSHFRLDLNLQDFRKKKLYVFCILSTCVTHPHITSPLNQSLVISG
jgi:hypothetical protein